MASSVAAILVAAIASAPVDKVPLSSFLVLLGDASYSFYLSHPYVVQLWMKASLERLDIATQLAMGAITCVVAVVVSLAFIPPPRISSQRMLLGRDFRGRYGQRWIFLQPVVRRWHSMRSLYDR
ncbi:hypothetical protein [Sinorhizobium terangae]|uniref:hypothetical protein n=1 Tax=Sinorhizobium terangae TaxID=110322 RepID=UPI00362A1D22